jgi:hypothetical protein
MRHTFYQTLIIIIAAVVVVSIAAVAMNLLGTPVTGVSAIPPVADHVEPTGPLAAIRMLGTLIQVSVVATIVIKISQYRQRKRRALKQHLAH